MLLYAYALVDRLRAVEGRLRPSRGPRSELITDADGWPLELAIRGHGAPLRLRRRRWP